MNFQGRENSLHLSYGRPLLHPYEHHQISRNMSSFEHLYKTQHNSHFQSPNQRFESHHNRGVNFLFQHPRSFEELHAERGYLINNLQLEDSKAVELLKKITNIQEDLKQRQEFKVRRQCEKTLKWLINRMTKTTRQERWILQRLGQVTQEIQYRERMSRIEDECYRQQFCNGFQHLQLDAATPEFTPYLQEYQQLNEGDGAYGYDGKSSHELAAPVGFAENGCSAEQMETPLREFCERRSSSMVEDEKQPIEDRRQSMPELSTRRIDERPESGAAYLGYYVTN